MTNTPSANDLLMGGGVKAAAFETLGTVVRGKIVDDPKVQQMRKYQSDELDFWPSGDPKMQIVVTIQTDQRDPADAEDDGRRVLYIPPRMMQPVRDAVKAAGAKGLAVGGTIAVQWASGTGQGQGNPKVYTAAYQPPQLDPGSLLSTPNGTVTPAAVATQPPMLTTPAPAATVPSNTMSLLTAATTPAAAGPPAGSNIDPAVWSALPAEQQRAVLAALGQQPGF